MGEPDFDTPSHIRQAGIAAIEAGQTRYTAVDGTPALKQAIIGKLARDNGLDYEPSQILVSSGAKQSIYNLFQALLNEDDEVLIPPRPTGFPTRVWCGWPGARPGHPEYQRKKKPTYLITASQLEASITDQTRLLIFNSPSNPTGRAYNRKQLAELAEVLLEHPRLLICSDDIYEHIWWADEPFASLGQVATGAQGSADWWSTVFPSPTP